MVQQIWDSIAAEAEQTPLTEAQKQEVYRRLAAHEADPQAAKPWEQVEAEALGCPEGAKQLSPGQALAPPWVGRTPTKGHALKGHNKQTSSVLPPYRARAGKVL